MAAVATDLEELSSDLVVYAARLVRAVRRLHEQPASIRVLALLDELGPTSVSALARADRCSQPTMSLAVARLLDAAEVARGTDPADARCSVIRLTARGRRTLADARRVNGATVAARLAGVDGPAAHSPHDIATAVAVLRDLVDLVPPISETATL